MEIYLDGELLQDIEEVERIGKSEMLIKTKTGALLVDIKHIKTMEKENKVKYECKKKKV